VKYLVKHQCVGSASGLTRKYYTRLEKIPWTNELAYFGSHSVTKKKSFVRWPPEGGGASVNGKNKRARKL